MSETPTDRSLPEGYAALQQGDVPDDVFAYLAQLEPKRRMMIAKGVLPMKPSQLAMFTYMLIADQEPAIAKAAEDNFVRLPPSMVEPLLSGRISGKVLAYAARIWIDNPDYHDVVSAVVRNSITSQYTIEHLIRHGSAGLLEVIADNQARLQKNPELIYAFAENPAVMVPTISRVLEFARRQHLIPARDEQKIIDQVVNRKSETRDRVGGVLQEPAQDSLPKDTLGEPVFPNNLIEEGQQETIEDVLKQRDAERRGEVRDAKTIEEEIEKKLDIREQIKKMTVSEKLRLAKRGNMEARNILVFDAVPLVAKNVLASPRVTKTEIERWAAMKILDPEILMEIVKNAEYMKNYQTRLNLVYNPKVPIAAIIKIMGTLMEKDIKNISKSKAVPNAVANIARGKLSNSKARKSR